MYMMFERKKYPVQQKQQQQQEQQQKKKIEIILFGILYPK